MSPIVAVSAYYFFLFAGIGVFWPNYGPFIASLGVSSGEAATIMSLHPLMGLLVPPVVGLLADARRASVWILRTLSLAAALAFGTWLGEPQSRLAIYGVAVLFATARAPITSLADATTFEVARHAGTSFGRLRLWGSIGFLVTAPIGGLLLEHGSATLMIAAATTCLLLAAVCTFQLPAPPIARQRGTFAAWLSLVRHPEHRLYLVAVFFAYIGGGALDGCFSLHLANLGHGASFRGFAWMMGVFSEVVLMHYSSQLIARWGATRILAAAQLVAVGRWLIIAGFTSPWVLMAQQPLHGITFGLTFVSAATIARRRAPAEAPAAAQGLFTAVASAGSLVGYNAGGQILTHAGGRALFVAASVCSLLASAAAWRLALATGRPRGQTVLRA